MRENIMRVQVSDRVKNECLKELKAIRESKRYNYSKIGKIAYKLNCVGIYLNENYSIEMVVNLLAEECSK